MRVATVQLIRQGSIRQEDLIIILDAVIKKSKRYGAGLVVLPGQIGLLIGEALKGKEILEPDDVSFQGIDTVYHAWSKQFATYYNISLTLGSYWVEEEELFSVAYLYNQKGEVLLKQGQIQLSEKERSWGIKPYQEINVAEFQDGYVLGFALGLDNYAPEHYRILNLQGANLVVGLSTEWGMNDQLAGIWQLVQQNQVYALESSLVGDMVSGGLGIFGPCEITPLESGVICDGSALVEERPVDMEIQGNNLQARICMADLSLESLLGIRKSYPINDLYNVELYRRWL